MSVLERARAVAVAAHGNAKYGHLPYWAHLSEVVSILKAFGVVDEAVLAAAWLHDAVEDTDLSLAEIEAEFGPEVAKIVDLVSKPAGGSSEAYFEGIAEHPGAVAVKLADRIANWSGAKRSGLKRLEAKYEAEYPVLLKHLYKPGLYGGMFHELSRIAA